ncbi:putative RNA-binding Zn-ribbon protein involved in translation (DUF1610 family) [Oxalobacteraceae bacterium GrIS 1.11]
MQTVSCPSCGAEVAFRSHASVMAVCGYCNTTVLKDAEAVKDLGKMSSVLEDYSPLQIGTAGVHGGQHFTVVGRIQLRYAAGMWNEWYLLFDDGSAAWLGDSSGLYTLTTERKVGSALPDWSELKPGQAYSVAGESYTAAEVRNAECVGGQGELPFRVGAGYRAQVADLRNRASFLTLDYSDGAQPVVFTGVAVTLESLACQLLRDEQQIAGGAGKYRGKLAALDCPSCGGPIKYLPGITTQLVCPACRAQIDAASPKAQVLAAGARLDAVQTTLQLGAQGKLGNRKYAVIGVMRRVDDENSEWTEYLLYNSGAGFLWLIESDEGWRRASVMEEWPTWHVGATDAPHLDNATFSKLYEYGARVVFAAGAFNWKVGVGDSCRVLEFEKGQTRLAVEITAEEMTWSRSTPLAADQIKSWFGADLRALPKPAETAESYGDYCFKGIVVMLLLSWIPLDDDLGRSWFFSLAGVLAIYLPAHFLGAQEKKKP